MNASGTYAALWIVVILQGILILIVLQQLAVIRQLSETARTEIGNQLPIGTPAPAFLGLSVSSGRNLDLKRMDAQGGILLFLSTECAVCQELAEGVGLSSNLVRKLKTRFRPTIARH